jgi:signal transduction histidine kinase
LRSGGAEPGPLLEALGAIEDLARRTAAEIDGIVSHLREPPAGGNGAVEAPTGLASLATLVDRHRAAGLDLAVAVSGAPVALGAAADQAAYRILQEALTNAARHGAGAARVEVAAGANCVTLTVTNPLTVADSSAATGPRTGRGHGLVGMQERATLVDGSLEAGPVDGAFRVHARIPGGPPGIEATAGDGEATGP